MCSLYCFDYSIVQNNEQMRSSRLRGANSSSTRKELNDIREELGELRHILSESRDRPRSRHMYNSDGNFIKLAVLIIT